MEVSFVFLWLELVFGGKNNFFQLKVDIYKYVIWNYCLVLLNGE